MLKKLKIKFIIVMMTIVTILLGTGFVCIMRLTQQNMERESLQLMQNLTMEGGKHPPSALPKKKGDKMILPLFTIVVSREHTLSAFGDDFYDLSDEAFLKNLMEYAEANKNQVGVIKQYDLRFYKSKSQKSNHIVFADISAEKAMLKALAKNAVIIGSIAYVLLFGISILLAEWMTKPVETAWNEQKQFIADASHELKTPLTVIMTNAEMLCDDVYSEAQKEDCNRNILSMSKRMRGLVENLLNLARMDGGIAKNEFTSVDFSKLVSDCILPFEPLFFERNMELQTAVCEGISVHGDAVQLKQMVDILLDNALKYADENSTVNVKLTKTADSCELSVASKGAELSKADCKNIFKRFYRVDKARSDGSYGLGLSIADSIVRKHNGKIHAESKEHINTFLISFSPKR